MDGELWMGRGTFEKLSGIVRKIQPNHNDWRQVRYMLFELSEHPETFTRRARNMVKLTETLKMAPAYTSNSPEFRGCSAAYAG